MTLVELTVSLLILSTMSLAIALMFRLAITAQRLCSEQTRVLSNVRKALHGDGPVPGMIFDTLYASSATAASSSSSLFLVALGGATTSYALSASDLQRTAGGSAANLAAGLSNLSFAYYMLDPGGRVVSTTTYSAADLVTFTFRASLPRTSPAFYSGARLKNRP